MIRDDLVAPPAIGGGLGELPAAVGEGAQFFERQAVEAPGLGRVDASPSQTFCNKSSSDAS